MDEDELIITNSGHYFEILDRSYLVCDIFERYIFSTLAIERDSFLSKEAEKIAERLGKFYGLVGQLAFEKEALEDLGGIYKKAWR